MSTQESVHEAARLRFRFQMNNRLRLESLAAISKVFRDFGEPIEDELLSSMVFAVPEELLGEYASFAEMAALRPPPTKGKRPPPAALVMKPPRTGAVKSTPKGGAKPPATGGKRPPPTGGKKPPPGGRKPPPAGRKPPPAGSKPPAVAKPPRKTVQRPPRKK